MGFGLLRDVDDFSNARHYTTDHQLSTNLLEPGPFYQAAKFDAKKKKLADVDAYLALVQNRLRTFCASDQVFGRQELQARVAEAMESPTAGGVTFLLGRRAVGKTKVLMAKVKEMNAASAAAAVTPSSVASTSDSTTLSPFVVYVNGRKTPSLAQGIKLALQNFDDKKMFENVPWEAMRLGLQGGGSNSQPTEGSASSNNGVTTSTTETATKRNGSSSGGCSSFAQLFASIQGKNDEDAKLIELIVLLAAAKKKRPCLVVDEADICLPCGESNNNKTTLAMIYGLTQDQVMNIILSSSDFAYPRNIANCSGILLSLTRTLYMEEFSPQSMWDLLVEDTNEDDGEPTVGMGNKLARFCISTVGGNPRTVQQLVHVLRERKESFCAFGDVIHYDIEGAAQLERFLDEKKRKSDAKSLLQILTNLGEQGFWEVEAGNSRVVDRLIADGIANSVLTSDLIECPLTEESFRVLVPSSQILRHLILEQVNERNTGLMSGVKGMFSRKGK